MTTATRFGLLCFLAMLAASRMATAAELPPLTVPAGLGVNIHFTDPQPGELAMLTAGGFRWVRMDLTWESTERVPGQYDFTAYDRLLAELEKHQVRSLWILNYSNPHYDGGLSPHSDAGRQAFARWAVAAARHFRGHGILWEIYNEPNIDHFWKPKVDPAAYVQLALTVSRALREAVPDEAVIGPATSRIDLKFLETCFQAGLLEYWQAVSVHPYRKEGPETAISEYEELWQLIAKYAPAGKTIPILAGEWGYSSGWKEFDAAKQGKFFPREYLTNLSQGIPVTIWYDWHDDGETPEEPEFRFGTVAHPYLAGHEPVYDPKPAHTAARTLTKVLDGFTFQERLPMGDETIVVLAFQKGNATRWAVWTTGTTSRLVTLPLPAGHYQVTDHLGQATTTLTATDTGLALSLTDAPQYLVGKE